MTSGRVALVHALRLGGVGPGDEVLVPAYYCEAITNAINWTGARCVFYAIHGDTTIDEQSLQERLSERTKAVVVIHYFGFLQALGRIRAICDEHGAALIEDCAHALFARGEGSVVGTVGDFAIGSLMKFLPLFDGGCLVSRQRSIDGVETRTGSLSFEIKAFTNILERATRHGRLPVAAPVVWAVNRLKSWIGTRVRAAAPAVAAAPAAADGGVAFEPTWLSVGMSLGSRLVTRLAAKHRLIERRRWAYLRLAREFAGLAGCEVLHPSLPDDVVPYVFPLLVTDADRVFSEIREAGIPAFRWENADVTSCPVTARYARGLLQLPCHQDLSEKDMSRLVVTVRQALARSR